MKMLKMRSIPFKSCDHKKKMMIVLLSFNLFIVVHSAIDTNPNCSVELGNLKDPACPATMKVNWWNFAPYVYIQSTNQLSADLQTNGTFKEIVERMIRKCCGDCVQFDYLQPSVNSEILKSRIGSNGSVVNFPVYGTLVTEKFQNYPYFPVVESPGIIYIEAIVESGSSATAVMDAVFMGWPVLVLTLIMAALSGIIMWALDSYWNPDEFPHSFFRGSWEGFWWAFVSMTTVGYGDKAPRSFIARVFAFFWVLIGLVIISIFTATVTTALTALSMGNEVELFGKTVVALNHTEEQRYGVRANAQVNSVSSVTDFVNSITGKDGKTEKPAGGLLDSYVAGYEKDKLGEDKGVRVAKIFDHTFTYGFVISNELDNTNIPKCIRRQLSNDESWIVDKIQRTMKALPEPKKSAAEEKSSNMFDPSSTVFQTAVFVCLAIIAFLTICGILWENCYWKPKLAKEEEEETEPERTITPHTTYEDLVSLQCQELEDAMVGEVMGFYKAFSKKMDEIRKFNVQSDPVEYENEKKDIKLLDMQVGFDNKAYESQT